ncbi:TetR/AcrR family transcriptional regulator [Enterobacter sp. K16B]|uniref:TetR/AcrR family transcriptional regulator n=1 Tax=Enterobacter sp. K16B TaxID=2878537 RepID=UPI001CDA2E72|nr:TetR/AcrR family transcriptional regulator [Enterobacter sp. K16B]MCA2024655.1 TetR/AcrR family transcriptional regulator [Enterobacter sp. K16B]
MRLISRIKQGEIVTRKKEIDREQVLDAAESLILESGGRVFTLDAVAERACISKGGLVYTFSSKDGLIYAVLEREVTRFQQAVRRRLTDTPAGPRQWILAHIEEALEEEDAVTQMAAFLITALVHAPGMLEPVRNLYHSLLEPLREQGEEMANVRHAFLAVEGIFLLRGLGLADIPAGEIKSVLRYAREMILTAS